MATRSEKRTGRVWQPALPVRRHRRVAYRAAVPSDVVRYEPTLESLRAHPVPAWFGGAKFGIFIHWGVFSIPAWAPTSGTMFDQQDPFRNTPYTEWYLNSLALEGSPVQAHHRDTYGVDYPYDAFAPQFKEAIRGWDPTIWADLFAAAGARYVVFVTKHHDGFLLWPSRHPNPFKEGWHSDRDLVGELGDAVRARGLTYGLYYSGGLDWTFGGAGIDSFRSMVKAIPQGDDYARYADAHWRELIERYRPAVLWNDIGYPTAGDSPRLFADYYNAYPDGVVNNRFDFLGVSGGTAHADFTTPEYATMAEITAEKWESCRGIGHSFGLNRNEPDAALVTVDGLVHMLVDIVSKNGNLLLNVGPAADGRIPHAQAERLLGLGWWLRVNGEAIYDTSPWTKAAGSTAEGLDVRFTSGADATYACALGRPPGRTLTLEGVTADSVATITMLGHHAPLSWSTRDRGLVVELPAEPIDTPAVTLRASPAGALRPC